MVDPARLRDLLIRIESRVARLESYGRRSEEEFTSDEEGTAAAKYFLLTAIEDALAVANHIIASEGYRGPADYPDAFRVLTEEGVLDRELGVRLEAMARFRNLLVHGYAKVDDQRVHGFLRTDLRDLASYVRSVLEGSLTWDELQPPEGIALRRSKANGRDSTASESTGSTACAFAGPNRGLRT